jgi:hypothetical protein
MNDSDRIRIDAIVCRGLGKLPGETLDERARICLRRCKGRKQLAAHALVSPGGSPDPWERMRRAACILRGLSLVPREIA